MSRPARSAAAGSLPAPAAVVRSPESAGQWRPGAPVPGRHASGGDS